MYKENDYMQMAEELITCDKLGVLQKNMDRFAMFEGFTEGRKESSFFVSSLSESLDENLMVFTLQEYDDFMLNTAGKVSDISLAEEPKKSNRIHNLKVVVSDNIEQMIKSRKVRL